MLEKQRKKQALAGLQGARDNKMFVKMPKSMKMDKNT